MGLIRNSKGVTKVFYRGKTVNRIYRYGALAYSAFVYKYFGLRDSDSLTVPDTYADAINPSSYTLSGSFSTLPILASGGSVSTIPTTTLNSSVDRFYLVVPSNISSKVKIYSVSEGRDLDTSAKVCTDDSRYSVIYVEYRTTPGTEYKIYQVS